MEAMNQTALKQPAESSVQRTTTDALPGMCNASTAAKYACLPQP